MRKLLWYFVAILFAISSIAAWKGLDSSVYDWEKVPVKKTVSGEVKDFLRDPTRSLEMFEIKAVTLFPDKEKWNSKVPDATDDLIIIKEGIAEIRVNEEQKILGEGSVIVAGEDNELTILNHNKSNLVFYIISFKPFGGSNKTVSPLKISPLFVDWKNVEFKPSENGGRRNIMQQKTSVLKELEIHVTTLKEGLPSHAAHTHPDEEIILVRKGYVEETIKGESFRLGRGSIIFLTNDDLHGISNSGKGECEYYAIRWLTY
jgi:mannose-6-phosphate isomerase-like protein (cupin superfamily)